MVDKSAMIGACGKAHATGDHTPNASGLKKPLEGPDSVMKSFCVGCGNMLELTYSAAEAYALDAETTLPSPLDGFYFRTGSCSLCDGTDKTVTLEPIV